MSFGGGPSRTAQESGWRPPTTMLDVIFLILTFFITVASFRDEDRQINVSLPTAEARSPSAANVAPLTITVNRDEKMYMGDQEFPTLDALNAKLTELARLEPGQAVLIRGDRDTRYGAMVRAMDVCKQAGLNDVSLAVAKPESDVGR